MSDVVGHVLEGIGHALVEAANWIPAPRWEAITEAWAWPIAACLAGGGFSLLAALWLGHPWLYRLTLGAFIGAFALACIAALWSKPSRGAQPLTLRRSAVVRPR